MSNQQKHEATEIAPVRGISSVPRTGANGVLLKKFETVMYDMLSPTHPSTSTPVCSPCHQALAVLTPRYSQLPPRTNEVERQSLTDNARAYWLKLGLDTPCHQYDEPNNNIDASNIKPSPWPFDTQTHLPSCGCVKQPNEKSTKRTKTTKTKTGKDTGGVGDVIHGERAWRKEMQLFNMIECVLALLPDRGPSTKQQRAIRIVDFAGGTGHLAVPLALLLPHCKVVCVDLKKWSLDLLHRRVDGLNDEDGTEESEEQKSKDSHKLPVQANATRTSKILPNLSTYYGSIQSYPEHFDIGISLHACGEASDWVLRKCIQKKASFVVCSCCCGKLRQEAKNPYVYQSTGVNDKEISYPQSKAFASLGQSCGDNKNAQQRFTPAMFDELAKSADYSELGDVRKPRNACRRAAKSLVEWDRLLFAKERMSIGETVLARMIPWEASAKNDVLIGWFDGSTNPYRNLNGQAPEDAFSEVDFQTALKHLFGKDTRTKQSMPSDLKDTTKDQNDWTAEEEAEIQSQLEVFLSQTETSTTDDDGPNYSEVLRFPTGMGSRKRKLVHYVAEKMGMRHWGEGKKDAAKIVVVSRRRN